MVQLGVFSEDSFHRWDSITNAYVPCTVLEWQNEMIQVGHYTDEIFVRTAAELLGRQIILYPVIPNQNDGDRVIVSPSIESTHEPFHIIYYEEANFINPHYQSVRPRDAPPLSSNSNSIPGNHGQPSLLSRLATMNTSKQSNQSTFGKLFLYPISYNSISIHYYHYIFISLI